MMTTKDINVADLLTYSDRAVISKIVSERVFAEYGDMYEFKWQMSVRGHFQIPATLCAHHTTKIGYWTYSRKLTRLSPTTMRRSKSKSQTSVLKMNSFNEFMGGILVTWIALSIISVISIANQDRPPVTNRLDIYYGKSRPL